MREFRKPTKSEIIKGQSDIIYTQKELIENLIKLLNSSH